MQIILSQILQSVEGVHGVNLIILEFHILKQGYKSECWFIISDAAPLATHPVATTVSQLLSFSIVQ